MSLWSGLPGELDPPGHRGQPRGLAPAAGLHLRLGLGGLQEDPGAGHQEQVEEQTTLLYCHRHLNLITIRLFFMPSVDFNILKVEHETVKLFSIV